MKLLTYTFGGQTRFGAVTDKGVVDLFAALNGRFADLKSLLADPKGIELASAAAAAATQHIALAQIKYEPVIPNPDKIICVGLNYHAHRIESERDETENPTLFLRMSGSQQGHGQPLLRPRESTKLDFEGEIALVIGKGGRRISEAQAWEHIAGYSCYNDGSVRDWQRHTTQWTAGKNFARTGGFGPWMVTADEIPANTVLTLLTRLNGVEMQRTTTDLLIHSIPRQIAYISKFIALEPGDVIVTGTPGGVGVRREPPVFMKPGDIVEIEVDRVGVLSNGIADD
ncbi:MAG: fumarylacetoacetate hydrolase family protein [Burkholderiaceae bacterium]|nr:fumarylacetoacetate hydrolase family protein [Burkholderiaceae bacterium]